MPVTYTVMNEPELDFERWYRDEHPRVLVAVTVVCGGDHARAEDATNDAFVKAFEKWDRVASMDSPRAWVTKVAINGAKRTLRRRAHRIALLNSERLNTEIGDRYPDVDLWAALDKLTFRQRKAIILRYMEDLPQGGVATGLGVAVGTASATLTQARTALRSELTMETKDD